MPRAKHVCIVCSSHIQQLHTALNCEECNRWQHLKCGTGTSQSFYWKVVRCLGVFEWSCSACSTSTPSEGNETSQISPQPKRRCSCLDGDGHPTTPAKRRQPASIPSQSAAPVSSQPITALVSSQPTAPFTSQLTTPVSSQATAPISSQSITALVSSQSTAPFTSQLTTPVSSQSTAPVSSQSTAPVSSQSSASVSSQSTGAVSSQSTAPFTSQPTTPVSSQSTAPVSSQSTAPVSSLSSAPVSSQSTGAVSSQSTAPFTSQSTAPVSSQSTAPVSSQSTAPVSSQSSAPVSSQSTGAVSSQPAAPVSSCSSVLLDSDSDSSDSDSDSDAEEKGSVTFTILKEGSHNGSPLLLSSDGYNYRQRNDFKSNLVCWACCLITCRASVNQYGDDFQHGPIKHNHPPTSFLRLRRDIVFQLSKRKGIS